MIVVTGGAGFIGSALIWTLNRRGRRDILVVDQFDRGPKWKNLRGLDFHDVRDKERFMSRLRDGSADPSVETVFHLGARTDTTEDDVGRLLRDNYRYTVDLARWALERDVRFIYASSAATYGDGSGGYDDDPERLGKLRPLNPYAYSKHLFDRHARQRGWLDAAVGLKFFNVYGPHEYHKGNMRSMVHKGFEQARDRGVIRLFKSHRPEVEHGEQKRDFLYVKDAVNITLFFHDHPGISGIFNAGTGRARSFNDMARAVLDHVDGEGRIEYFDMPEELRDQYQYFTEADLTKLRGAGYEEELVSLEEGIRDYLNNYLLSANRYLSLP